MYSFPSSFYNYIYNISPRGVSEPFTASGNWDNGLPTLREVQNTARIMSIVVVIFVCAMMEGVFWGVMEDGRAVEGVAAEGVGQ